MVRLVCGMKTYFQIVQTSRPIAGNCYSVNKSRYHIEGGGDVTVNCNFCRIDVVFGFASTIYLLTDKDKASLNILIMTVVFIFHSFVTNKLKDRL